MRAVVIDANLLALLLVGGCKTPGLIQRNRNTKRYDLTDFELLGQIVSDYASIVLTPGILAETSNLARQMPKDDWPEIGAQLRKLIDDCEEIHLGSRIAANRPEFSWLGLVDAAILALCTEFRDGLTLLTHDGPLLAAAYSLHLRPIDFEAHR